MKVGKTLPVVVLVIALGGAAAAQHAEHPHQAPAAKPAEPGAGPAMALEEFERMALANNPTLAQAEAEIRSARGRTRQAGLYPNPVVGYTGEEIRGGAQRGGQHGFFVEQNLVLSGKLGLGRRVAEQDINLATIEADEQRMRVLNGVRIAYHQVLAAQEMLEARRGFAKVAADALETSQRLRNIGQIDETEVLQAEVEAQQAELGLARQQNQLRRAWGTLAAVVGNPKLPPSRVAGRLDENLPAIDEAQLLERVSTQSPALRIAQAGITRAEAALRRARREPVPDLQLRAGLQQNREHAEGTRRPLGLQGFAEIGVQLPIFNRNQGNVQAASAELERSQQEARRVQLLLLERAQATVEVLSSARITVERYRAKILPNAQRAHELMVKQWGQMRASYPQVLLAQRTMFEAQASYIAALEELWTTSLALQGFLLTDALEAPARPSEIDVPVREVNLPSSRLE